MPDPNVANPPVPVIWYDRAVGSAGINRAFGSPKCQGLVAAVSRRRSDGPAVENNLPRYTAGVADGEGLGGCSAPERESECAMRRPEMVFVWAVVSEKVPVTLLISFAPNAAVGLRDVSFAEVLAKPLVV